MIDITANLEWLRKGSGSGVPSGYSREAQVTDVVNVSGVNRNVQVVFRVSHHEVLEPDFDKEYRIRIEEVI